MVGHSSGEIAAAFAAGMLSSRAAMAAAYFRGALCSKLAQDKSRQQRGAMLAVGLSEEQLKPYSDDLREAGLTIACFNSSKSVTLSGNASSIDAFHEQISGLGHFSRKLKVDVAYHSVQMELIADEYRRILSRHVANPDAENGIKFHSSVHPRIRVETNYEYWVQNMVCPVRFSDALSQMIAETNEAVRPDILMEIGPHSALAGPVRQTLSEKSAETDINYLATLQRGIDDHQSLLSAACHLFGLGTNLDFGQVNFPQGTESLSVLSKLPIYPWNHGTIYWHEGRNSTNYLHQEFPTHDLLGKLTPDSSIHDMKWINHLSLSQLPWLRDHTVRGEVIFPGTAYLTMATEAACQKAMIKGTSVVSMVLRDVSFTNALPIPDTMPGVEIGLLLEPMRYSSSRTSDTWDVFRIVSYSSGRKAIEHCHGLVNCCMDFTIGEGDYDENIMAQYSSNELKANDDWINWLPIIEAGSAMGPCFKLFTGSLRSSEKLVCSIQIPDTNPLMPMNYESQSIVGAPLLDAILQTCALHAEKIADFMDDVYPTYVKEIGFSLDIRKPAGETVWTESRTEIHSPRDLQGTSVLLASNQGRDLIPIARMTGARYFITKRQTSTQNNISDDPNLCTRVVWNCDPDNLRQIDAESLWGHGKLSSDQNAIFALIEKAAWLCLRSTWESKAEWKISQLPKHYRHLARWIEAKYAAGISGDLVCQTHDWSIVDDKTIEETLRAASSTGANGEMIVKLGRNLNRILTQAIDPLSLMLEDDLLDRYYEAYMNQDGLNRRVGQYMHLNGFKSPGQKILEIGAGTGGTTGWILKALSGQNSQRLFSKYTFTDISAGFFEKARVKFEKYSDSMEFRALNVEKDPTSEAFTEQYDVVVAANVLHATACMEKTMQNVNKLLKPGGKLVLIELAHLVVLAGPLVFGTLPGWWLGKYEAEDQGPI